MFIFISKTRKGELKKEVIEMQISQMQSESRAVPFREHDLVFAKQNRSEIMPGIIGSIKKDKKFEKVIGPLFRKSLKPVFFNNHSVHFYPLEFGFKFTGYQERELVSVNDRTIQKYITAQSSFKFMQAARSMLEDLKKYADSSDLIKLLKNKFKQIQSQYAAMFGSEEAIKLKILQKNDLYQGKDQVRACGLRLFSIKESENQVETFIEMVPEDPPEEQDRLEKECSKSVETESGDENRNTGSKKIQQKVSKEVAKSKKIYKIYKKDGIKIVKRPLFLKYTSQEDEEGRECEVSFTLRERGDHQQYEYFEGNKTKDRDLNLGFDEDGESQYGSEGPSNQDNERQYANIFSQQEEQMYIQKLNQDAQMRPEIRVVEEVKEQTQMKAEIRHEEDGQMIAEIRPEQGLDQAQNLPVFGPQNISDLSTAASLNSGNSGDGRALFDPFEIDESTRASTNFSMPQERNAFEFRFDEQSSINMSLSTQFLNEFGREDEEE